MTNIGSSGLPVPETEALLQRVAGMIASARALPLSSSVKLDNKDEILELLREASERLPEELRQARWMMKEREEYLAATQRQADELVEAARSEAQRLVQRNEIVKEAQAEARRAREQAREEARRLKLEAEDYVDHRLAQFEIILERTMKTVAAGRHKLSGGLSDRPDDSEELSTGVPGGLGQSSSLPPYGQSPAPYSQAPAGYGAPGASYGAAVTSYGQAPPGYGQAAGTYAPSPAGYGPGDPDGRWGAAHPVAPPSAQPSGGRAHVHLLPATPAPTVAGNSAEAGAEDSIFDQDSLE